MSVGGFQWFRAGNFGFLGRFKPPGRWLKINLVSYLEIVLTIEFARLSVLKDMSVVTYGSSNIFADLGFEDSEEMLAKAKLAIAIKDVIKERELTQVQAAELMGIDQPRVSKLISGRLGDFSTDRLLHYLLQLGSDVEIVVHRPGSPAKREGAMSVAYL